MIQAAVIGTGNMGLNHIRVYSEKPDINLVAICDKDTNKARILAEKYNTRYYSDYQEMFSKEKIDCVSIVVPTFLHYQVAMDVIRLGKHILLEKPIATNKKEAEEIIKYAQKKKVKLMIGHIERFNPAVQRLKDIINQGRLGRIISINIKRVGGLPPQIKNANVVLDLGIHDIDIANYLIGEYPQKTIGYKSKSIVDDQEDNAVVLMEYKNACAVIEVNWVTLVKVRTLDLTCTKGFARLDYIYQTLHLYENSFNYTRSKAYADFGEFIEKFSTADEVKIGIKKAEPLRLEIDHFIDCIRNDKKPLTTGIDALKALQIAMSI